MSINHFIDYDGFLFDGFIFACGQGLELYQLVKNRRITGGYELSPLSDRGYHVDILCTGRRISEEEAVDLLWSLDSEKFRDRKKRKSFRNCCTCMWEWNYDAYDELIKSKKYEEAEKYCPPTKFTDIAYLGEDERNGRFGDVSLWQCCSCGRYWLEYHVEYSAFSRSGRYFRGLIEPEYAKKLKPGNAVRYLSSLDWYLQGGSYFGDLTRQTGPLGVDFLGDPAYY